METAQWPQQKVERRVRPHKEQALNCPRCNSSNTKFCYYNNYSLSQPRYFCKSCRRYWTEGGSLRNVPVGGGSRKNKRSNSSSSSSSLPSSTTASVASSTSVNIQPSKLVPHKLSSFSISSSVSALDPIRSGISSSMANELSANAMIKLRASTPSHNLYWQELHALDMPIHEDFGMQEFMWPSKVKMPLEYGVGGKEEGKEGGEDGKLPFPFEDLKQDSIRNACDDSPTLFWEGPVGNGEGGGW